MTHSLFDWAPYVGAAIVGILFLGLRLHGEAMKYVIEVQFFLNQKTIAYNRLKASLSIIKTKMHYMQKRFNRLEHENFRLRKSLEVMAQYYNEREPRSQIPSHMFMEKKTSRLADLNSTDVI